LTQVFQNSPKKPANPVHRITTFIVLFLGLFLPCSARADQPLFRYESTLSLTSGPVGQSRPVAVTCDPVIGEVCVTDIRQTSLHILNRHDIELFRTSAVARLAYPLDGCVDPGGRLVCLDRSNEGLYTLKRLNAYGEPDSFAVAPPLENWNPAHLTIARDGNYLTLDAGHGLLAKHSSETGRMIWSRQVVTTAGEDLFLGRPCETAQGNIIIPGGNMRRILVLDEQGNTLRTFGEFGSAEGYVSFPVAAATTPDGMILILDRMRHKILAFDQDCRFVSEFGSMGSASGQFYHPVAMAADAENRVYVAQGFQGRVQVFRYAGAVPSR
jgi:DNA-binding beta-propeller fold protein YncE